MGHTFPMFMFDLSPPFPHGQGCNFLERIVNTSFPTELCQFTTVPNICATSILNLCRKYKVIVLLEIQSLCPSSWLQRKGDGFGITWQESTGEWVQQASPSCIFLLNFGYPSQVICLSVSGMGSGQKGWAFSELFLMLPRKDTSTACPHLTQ